MYKEKHILNKTYGNHQISRYLDVYETSTINCSANKLTGYAGDNVTVTSTPVWNQKFSGYSITGSNLTGNDFKFVNSDVIVAANYETAKNLTLQTDGHGTIAASRMSGFIGDQVTLSNTANVNYSFSAYSITGANLTGDTFNLTGSDVTAKAWFFQPVAKLADTSQSDIWVPKRNTSLNPTYETTSISFNSNAYRYVVYSLLCVFNYDGHVSLLPNSPTTYPSIYSHWCFAKAGSNLYIAQLSNASTAYINNVNAWTNGQASTTSYLSNSDPVLAGNFIQCTNYFEYPFFKLIVDKQASKVSAYFANNDYSNDYIYQGCATVNTIADSTRLQTHCNAQENHKVNAHVKVYGCATFSDATGCHYYT